MVKLSQDIIREISGRNTYGCVHLATVQRYDNRVAAANEKAMTITLFKVKVVALFFAILQPRYAKPRLHQVAQLKKNLSLLMNFLTVLRFFDDPKTIDLTPLFGITFIHNYCVAVTKN